jgi:hypothetical protein
MTTNWKEEAKRFLKLQRKAQKLTLRELGIEYAKCEMDVMQIRNPDPGAGFGDGDGFSLVRPAITRRGLAHFLALEQFIQPLFAAMEELENEVEV